MEVQDTSGALQHRKNKGKKGKESYDERQNDLKRWHSY